jgi:glucose/arabinose dehydrogenase
VAALTIGTTVLAGAATPAAAAVPTTVTTISTGWTIPWGMDWLPDGRALITERDSFRVHTLARNGTKTFVGSVPNAATTGGEGGLLGAAVSPDFAQTGYVYFFHTAASDNRIVRMRLSGTSLSGYTTLVTGIARARFHDGGRIAFGPDGYLYATTGDAQNTALAQNRNSLNGKILRMRPDGTPAPGNPFGTLVYSIGHRNPQGIAWDSAGRLWAAEFGQNRFDELNLIKAGQNYGWPTCEGSCDVAGLTSPKRQWATGEASPSAIAIADDVVYMAALRGERLWRIALSGEDTETPQAYYVNQYGRLRTVVTVPGGNALWLSTTNADANGGEPAGADRVFQVTLA